LIKNVGLDLHFIDPRKEDVSLGRFTEANLFMLISNGDDYLSVDETAEFLRLLFSGKTLSSRIHSDITELCKDHWKGVDPFGQRAIEVSCYEKTFFQTIGRHLDHLPGVVAHYKGLDRKGRKEFQKILQAAAIR